MLGLNTENDNSDANVNRCDGMAQFDGILDDVFGRVVPPGFRPINPNSN